jgi:hypothetical protein
MLGTPVETLKLLNETAQQAAGVKNRVQIFRPDAEPAHVYLIATPVSIDGKEAVSIERREADPPPRSSTIVSVASIAGAIETLRLQLPAGHVAPIVWYTDWGFVIELDRRSRVHCPFDTTPVVKSLLALPARFEPKGLRKWLRVSMADCWAANVQRLHDALASLKFNVNKEARGTISAGRESMGRDLDAQVKSEYGELPEWIELTIPLVRDPAIVERHTVRIDVDIDAVNGTIELTLMPDALQKAMQELLRGVVSNLRDDLPADVQVIHGQPDVEVD